MFVLFLEFGYFRGIVEDTERKVSCVWAQGLLGDLEIVGKIKRDGETSGPLRRTSLEVSRDVSTESIQSGASTMGFIEIPVFSGDDLRPWINWMENRFAAEDFTDDQKMALAYGVIRGEAESWYNNRVSRRPFQNWKDLKDAMLLRYGNHDDP
ncbi:hypothetical protein YC2023_116352 [Brassica napus]